jgi:uncharacterized protein (DUF433 family)
MTDSTFRYTPPSSAGTTWSLSELLRAASGPFVTKIARQPTAARIVSTPATLGGKPRIAGRRISVRDVAIWHERMGLTVDEIAAKYDLSPDDVQAALTYYADHRDEIEESIRTGEAFVAEMRQKHPSKLKARRDG